MPEEENTENPTPGEGGDNTTEEPTTEGGNTTEGGDDTEGGSTTEGGDDAEGEGASGGNNDDTNEGDTNMTTTEITVLKPVMDNKQSYEIGVVASASKVAIASEMKILDAMACKNNSMTIFVDASHDGTLTIKAGDMYPNAVLGDAPISITSGDYVVIQLEDISRFENRDGSIDITTADSLAGKILVTGKRVGVDTVANQNTRDYNAHRTLHYDATYTG